MQRVASRRVAFDDASRPSARETRTRTRRTSRRASTDELANEGLARSKRTLAAISRRAFENKLIMWGMIAMLSLGVALLLYLQLFGFSAADGGADESAAVNATARSAGKAGGGKGHQGLM